ncbi:NAD-dependent epimerase/dehydratase family protein [Arthrobacter sp. zg-Y820]|uniref:NAD-dependent epimerase/dehydratase family protein n=1 Tax=unclassified Arthrobacter TaxID=235627 RepID=UPI001E4FEDD8|nr:MULTISPECIES: NAD-dependent epimerase/dehydratase family protein [unclassified Arthrobacter]MCC9197989.1 NAD-dependent epimerase/dehydratase family protein [Arthrobacter sp. zg-Y820]MDK1280856.1 NAD-dependent epimerase/dehydratase family protein [Arthrobacter sp. zg.Y820]MDK1360162.1 NAD-dependent epimerase/dehydratase family protein [Arthrobacter sp. zg-Y1219]WIB10335.1 NAD-dependent epimerase/dehydratase family protein [Arthrobacter sp. zg-Y820]
MKKSLVTGAGGFIGGHLVARLLSDGHEVRAVDCKPLDEWYQISEGAENIQGDCSLLETAHEVSRGMQDVYNLAADMGGMGFIENNKALCMLTVLTSTHMLVAARDAGAERFFYSSSACVYAADHQTNADVVALREEDAYPAQPEDGYGWEKLFTERMCRHFQEDYGLQTRVARFHNVYGPEGTWEGGREKAPAALCRKFAHASLTGELDVEIWGDGEQTRSFMYIDDCVRGILEIMNGDSAEPVNLGSAELVSINQMADLLEKISGTVVNRKYKLDAPQGVRGRNSDNTLFRDTYGWEPSISLYDGLERTYAWIQDQVKAQRV